MTTITEQRTRNNAEVLTRTMLIQLAERIIDDAKDPECRVEIMLERAKQATGLASEIMKKGK